jgi:hypothetical protein
MPREIKIVEWHAKARLVTSARPAFDGPFIECLRRWDRLPSELRSRAFIAANETIVGKELLKPSDLAEFITHPDYLTA